MKLQDELKGADSRRALSIDAVCNLQTKLQDKTKQATLLQKEVRRLQCKSRTRNQRGGAHEDLELTESEPDSPDTSAMEDFKLKLSFVERMNTKLKEKMKNKEKVSKTKHRQMLSENSVLLKEVSEQKAQNLKLREQIENYQFEDRASFRRRKCSSAGGQSAQECGLEGSSSLQRMPVTRPGSMRQFEFGILSEHKQQTTRTRPHSALKRRPFSATSLPTHKTPM